MHDASITERLAQRIADINASRLSEDVRHKAKLCLLDYAAALWNGTTHGAWHAYRDTAMQLGGKGTSPVVGEGRTSPFWAAFANSACSHLTEVDDTHKASSMHIGCCVFPAVFAVADRRHLDGEHFLRAVVCGYEAAIKIGLLLGREHATRFHSSGTAGTFGATAATAAALDMDAEGMEDAFGLAGTQALALWQFLSDHALDAKAFHPARAVQNGMNAAYLACNGVAGPVHILEGEHGYGVALGCRFDQNVVDGILLSDTLSISEVCFKSYPVCGQIHAPLDAMRELIAGGLPPHDAIASIILETYSQAMRLADKPSPTSMSEAKFSLQQCLATMLVHGTLTFGNCTEANCFSPLVLSMLPKIRVVHSDEMERRFPRERPCRLTVIDHRGRRYVAEQSFRRGDPESPLSLEEMENKFRQLAPTSLSPGRIDEILRWIWRLDGEDRVVTDCLMR